ncbi:MAG: gliding motility-associated C-terminal domain-containing protein [Bacteroidetes bacterium]|nr:gliding motility-associated C-terminal domain-containing protein [Bacteroidota bacterium]
MQAQVINMSVASAPGSYTPGTPFNVVLSGTYDANCFIYGARVFVGARVPAGWTVNSVTSTLPGNTTIPLDGLGLLGLLGCNTTGWIIHGDPLNAASVFCGAGSATITLNITPNSSPPAPAFDLFAVIYGENGGGMPTTPGDCPDQNIIPTGPPALAGGAVAGTSPICAGDDPAAFTSTTPASGGTAPYTYQWQTGPSGTGPWTDVGGNSLTYDPPAILTAGTTYYQRRVRDNSGPVQEAFSNVISITTNGAPTTANAGSPATVCTPTTTLSGNTPAVGTAAWSFVSGPATASVNASSGAVSGMTLAGDYVFRYTISSAPCTPSTSEVTITRVLPPTATASASTSPICLADMASLSLTGNTPAAGETGLWTVTATPSGVSPGSIGFSASAAAATGVTGLTVAGTYTFQWTMSRPTCTAASATVNVAVLGAPGMPAISPVPIRCTAGNVTLNGSNPGGFTPSWRQITGPAATLTPSGQTATVSLNTPGSYTFGYALSNTCGNQEATVTVTYEEATALFIADNTRPTVPGNPTVHFLYTGTAPGGSSYQWSFGSQAVPPTASGEIPPPVTYTQRGTYIATLTVTTPQGCRFSENMLLEVTNDDPLIMPSGFTPNNDGLNDVLSFQTQALASFTFVVYDRWGKEVFQTNDPAQYWNGKYQNTGNDAAEGSYVYVLKGVNARGETVEKNGSITLIR